ncbi:hypothetical protein SCP_1201990 [Sparassis crispa]|uniref:Protein kinase domain-containing protein n=1 Tax=Sparassis crispa TaxID=139825 RepID=A0A401H0P0_9APHY|nr:hypothetical protein SCP_1201990 [Sparassis crispa]GBE87973.1 hypothetical protein SCP_1201990 [Sparassis crispa]
MNVAPHKLPSYALCSPERAQFYAEKTRDGHYALLESETFWRDRCIFLQQHGYQLRPRYHPNWSPSWLGTTFDPTFCEDSILLLTDNVIDAVRLQDGELVSIKAVPEHSDEIRIARFLSSPELLEHPTNHSVPVLHVLSDPLDNQFKLMVMPFLRPFNNPPFYAIGEVIDFIQQTLEGLHFLHTQGIAHRDCASANIMMDARSLYSQGHHPVRLNYSREGIYPVYPLSRMNHHVKYYYIDFGISSQFQEGNSPYVTGRKGRDKELPELSFGVPYSAFKVDIFTLGNLYTKEFLQKYLGLEFLDPLVAAMTDRRPDQRPTAEGALLIFEGIRQRLNTAFLRWRLRARDESTQERVVYDAVAAAREGLYRLTHLISSKN